MRLKFGKKELPGKLSGSFGYTVKTVRTAKAIMNKNVNLTLLVLDI